MTWLCVAGGTDLETQKALYPCLNIYNTVASFRGFKLINFNQRQELMIYISIYIEQKLDRTHAATFELHH